MEQQKISKYLILNFENAKAFRGIVTSDSIVECGVRFDRQDWPQFKEPINALHVANVLRCLIGERPVPSLRRTSFKIKDELLTVALKGMIRIDNYKMNNPDFAGNYYQKETTKTSKVKFNSYSKQNYVHWERIRKLLDNELFVEFCAKSKTFVKYNPIDKPFVEFKKDLNNAEDKKGVEEMFLYFDNLKKKSLSNHILRNGRDINQNSKTLLMETKGVDSNVVFLKGRILIPIDQELELKIRNGPGTANILDNGMLFITGIVDSFMIDFLGFTPLSEIGCDTFLPKSLFNKKSKNHENKN